MLYDMFEICLLLLILLVLISLALGRVGLPSGGWPARRWIADVMFVPCYWCHGAVFRWLSSHWSKTHWSKTHWSKACPLVPVRTEGGELFVDQRYLRANRYLVCHMLVPQSPSLSWQSLR